MKRGQGIIIGSILLILPIVYLFYDLITLRLNSVNYKEYLDNFQRILSILEIFESFPYKYLTNYTYFSDSVQIFHLYKLDKKKFCLNSFRFLDFIIPYSSYLECYNLSYTYILPIENKEFTTYYYYTVQNNKIRLEYSSIYINLTGLYVISCHDLFFSKVCFLNNSIILIYPFGLILYSYSDFNLTTNGNINDVGSLGDYSKIEIGSYYLYTTFSYSINYTKKEIYFRSNDNLNYLVVFVNRNYNIRKLNLNRVKNLRFMDLLKGLGIKYFNFNYNIDFFGIISKNPYNFTKNYYFSKNINKLLNITFNSTNVSYITLQRGVYLIYIPSINYMITNYPIYIFNFSDFIKVSSSITLHKGFYYLILPDVATISFSKEVILSTSLNSINNSNGYLCYCNYKSNPYLFVNVSDYSDSTYYFIKYENNSNYLFYFYSNNTILLTTIDCINSISSNYVTLNNDCYLKKLFKNFKDLEYFFVKNLIFNLKYNVTIFMGNLEIEIEK